MSERLRQRPVAPDTSLPLPAVSAEPVASRVPLKDITHSGKTVHVAITRINPSLIDKAVIVLPAVSST